MHALTADQWRRVGTRGDFRYLDAAGRELTDAAQLERIRRLAIPPAWRDVRISPDPDAYLQAVGIDAAGRRQYRYHPDFRAQRERAKFAKLERFAERLPGLRTVMSADMERDSLERERISAVALRLIDEGWFRIGSERYVERGTYGIATLLKNHVRVDGPRVHLRFVGKHRVWIRKALVDPELADAVAELESVPGGPRLFRYRENGYLRNLTSERVNRYVDTHMGPEFNAKDFRTWGGTLTAAIGFAERGPAHTKTEQKRTIAAVMREVAERLANTPAVARTSYVCPAVVEEYVEGRTIAQCRPRADRVVAARDGLLSPEEAALMLLCRSWHRRIGLAG